MSDLNTVNLRDADAMLLNAYNESAEDGSFSGLVQEFTDPKGYRNFSMVTKLPVFQKLIDEVIPENLTSTKFTKVAEVYKNPLEIQRQDWDNARNIVDNPEFNNFFSGLGEDAIANREVILTTLLEANPTDILGAAMFADATTIPGSSVTLDNLVSGTGTSDAQIRADFRTADVLFRAMRNSGNRKMHRFGLRQKYIMMCPNALIGIMQTIFERKLVSSGEDNDLFGRVEIRANSYMTDADDWYLFSNTARHKPFGLLQEGPVELETDATGDPQKGVSRDAILRDTYLFSARDAFITFPLLRTGAVKVSN